ncbi:MAG: pseudouridine synthase family protein [Bdellovibrio sp.]
MIRVAFENDHFIICDKESGVLSTPSRFEAMDDRRCLGTELQDSLKIQIFPVHRLDFEVSGLVIYAKSAEAHRTANGWFENKQVSKTYRALTTGQDYSHIPETVKNPRLPLSLVNGQEFEWKSLLLRGKRRAYESPQGKPSLTLASYLGKDNADQFLMWDLKPVTGRSHQLRFDLSRHGFPIVGDKLYGSKVEWKKDSIALRSYKIDFSKAPKAQKLGLPEVLEISC